MIPLATTTITVTRADMTGAADPYDPDPPAPTVVASGVRAVIGAPKATTKLSGGTKVDYTATLRCDPCTITGGDTVTDAGGTAWLALWAIEVDALGLDFIEGELRLQTGAT